MSSRDYLGSAAQALTFGLTWAVASSFFGLPDYLWAGIVGGLAYFLVGLWFRSATGRSRDRRRRGHS